MVLAYRMLRAFFAAAVISVALFVSQAVASGAVLLTVNGAIEGDAVEFDREMLQRLDWREIRSWTSFTEGEQEFAGPTLASVLEAVGAKGTSIRAIAINDYAVSIPVDHANAHGVLLAVDHNGKPMRIRNKGPIWVIYPQSETEAKRQRFDAEMIWQLSRITVE